MSNLPAPVGLQVRVFASSSAASVVQQFACMYVPLASTTLCASPMVCGNGPNPPKNGGGATMVHLSATGS